MDRIEYHFADKTAWKDGPWKSEPDKVQWEDDATGYPCLVVRNEMTGALCGYVGVSVEHPAHGRFYDDVEVEVHGGLTYAAPCQEGEPEHGICHRTQGKDDVWWFGFDCAHGNDFTPGVKWVAVSPNGVYRTLSYVESECRALARQLEGINA